MKGLAVIQQQEILGKPFTMYGDFENPLFLAKEVAQWIEHSNPRMMLQGIDEDEKLCVNNPYALKGQQEQWFLTEDGVYEVLMQSRKPIAKQFKKKVKEILKSIRKHGMYVPQDMLEQIMNSPDMIIELVTRLKEERDKRVQLEQEIEQKNNSLNLTVSGVIQVSINKVGV